MATPPEGNGFTPAGAPDQEPEDRTPDPSTDPSTDLNTDLNTGGNEEAPAATLSPLVLDGDVGDANETEDEPPILVRPGEPGFPPPPEGIVEAAKLAPDHWLNVVDQHWEGKEGEAPPSWAMLGRWRSDENGEIVEWERNVDYRPSPEKLGWGEPVSPVDRAVQLAATGYRTEETVAHALAAADVAVCVDEEGQLSVAETPGGVPVVPVFSTSPDLDADRLPPHEVMPIPSLLERLREDEEILLLSSTAPVALLVTKSALRAGREAGFARTGGTGAVGSGEQQ